MCSPIFVIELLRDIVADKPIVDVFNNTLTELSEKSILPGYWIKNLMRPVFVMLLYLCAEKEGDFALHYLACKLTLPHFSGSTLEICKKWSCWPKVTGEIAQHTTQLVSRRKAFGSFNEWVLERDLE